MLSKRTILGVHVTNERAEKVLEYITQQVKRGHEKVFVFTPNPEIIVYAQKHPSFKQSLNEARVALPDGVGVVLAGLFLGKPFKERITGVDFMEELCKVSVKSAMSIGFLGGGPGIAQRTAECLKQRYPGLNVVFASQEWDDAGFQMNQGRNSKHTRGSKSGKNIPNTNYILHTTDTIDLLFVAFGFPKQEEWIIKHLPKLQVRAAMGVGGAFDFISGEVVRAPFLIRAMGFEWLFRLIVQPWRFRRQLALFVFVWLVIKERLGFRV